MGLICPFPAIIARAHAPPSLSTAPPPARPGGSLNISIFFTFASARCLQSPPGPNPQLRRTWRKHRSHRPRIYNRNSTPTATISLFHCSYSSSSIVFSAFWKFSVFGFLFRPVLYHDTLTAAWNQVFGYRSTKTLSGKGEKIHVGREEKSTPGKSITNIKMFGRGRKQSVSQASTKSVAKPPSASIRDSGVSKRRPSVATRRRPSIATTANTLVDSSSRWVTFIACRRLH